MATPKKEAPKKEASTQAADVKLPKDVSKELYVKAESLVVSGFKNNADPDVIKSEIFKLGIPFSRLNPLFNLIAKKHNLIADPKEVKLHISKALADVSITYKETYEELAALAAPIAEKVKGATLPKVMAALKADFQENEKEFPKKPKGTGSAGPRMGAVSKALIDLFKANPNPTKEDTFKAIRPHVKGDDNAKYYVNQYYKMLTAVKNGMSSAEILAKP